MSKTLRLMLVVVMAAFILAGCAKPPTEEINATKAAVDAVMADAEVYTPDLAASLKSEHEAAMAEVKMQDEKTFKSYGKAKEMLAATKGKAEAAVATVAAKKEEVKQQAMATQATAQAAVAEATELLKKAPRGKGTTEDIEALRADVKGLEESLPEVQTLLDGGNYMGALEKATAIETKAKEVSAQVTEAIAKKKGRK